MPEPDQPLDEPLEGPVLDPLRGPRPWLTLPDLDGVARTLRSFLETDGVRGAVVVFWSGVCSHCARYDDYLRGLPGRHPELALLAVASRQGETAEDLRRVVAERRLAFPILHDADRTVARRWRVEQTPRVFLLDRERRLLYRGAIDNFKYPEDPAYRAYLEPAIGDFLAGRPVVRVESPSFGCPVESVYYTMPRP